MPVLSPEKISVPFWQFNGHLQTILPNLQRVISGVQYQRERIDTWDHDFLDLDWSKVGSDTLVVISHGLAGSSDSPYVKSMVKISNQNAWDALAWNYRSCSGEPNRKFSTFHGGKSDDLEWVLEHALSRKNYKSIFLVGVSMGGNIILKMLGEWGRKIKFSIKGAVAISTPVDMYSTSKKLIQGWNQMYSRRYLKQYKQMLSLKSNMFEGLKNMNIEHIFSSENLHEFADRFTAPSFGFKDAEDYLISQSSLYYLSNIYVPSLLINADNDPFLTSTSYPYEEAEKSRHFHFLETINGGHVGFYDKSSKEYSWVDKKAIEFFKGL